jgi:hypothetical protein
MPAVAQDFSSQASMVLPIPSLRFFGCTASSSKCAVSSPNSMMENPCNTPLWLATSTIVSLSRIHFFTRAGVHRQRKPCSTCWREIDAISVASDECAARKTSISSKIRFQKSLHQRIVHPMPYRCQAAIS